VRYLFICAMNYLLFSTIRYKRSVKIFVTLLLHLSAGACGLFSTPFLSILYNVYCSYMGKNIKYRSNHNWQHINEVVEEISALLTPFTATNLTWISPESKPDLPSEKSANSCLISWHEPKIMRVAYNMLMWFFHSFSKYIKRAYLFTQSPISMQINNMSYKSDQLRQETKLIFSGLGT